MREFTIFSILNITVILQIDKKSNKILFNNQILFKIILN